MTKKEALRELFCLLVELYDDEGKASALADQAGIPTAAVSGRGTLATYWWNLLAEAHRRDRVEPLVMNAGWDYPERVADLKGAYAAYVGADDTGADIQPEGGAAAGPRVDTGGGAYIAGPVTVGGDFVGRDKMVYGDTIAVGDVWGGPGVAIGKDYQATVQTGVSAAQLAALFQPVNAQIDRRPDDPTLDKSELHDLVAKVRGEVAKGQAASPAKVERRLKQLIDWAPDVAEVALAALSTPLPGQATAIAQVAQRLRAGLP